MITGMIDDMVNTMVEFGVCTEEEFDLVSSINGYSVETVNDVLYARTGYKYYEDWFNDLSNED